MQVKSYRARTMREALALVRRELGPEAAVLRTREVRAGGLWQWIGGARQIEVMASTGVSIPSRLPPRVMPLVEALSHTPRHTLVDSITETDRRIEPRRVGTPNGVDSDVRFRLFADLIDAEMSEEMARECVERVCREASTAELRDTARLKERLAELLAQEVPIAGPIRVTPGRRHLVTLVGSTGVGKTTTIAKLAANFRLREKRRVGLITVDTYRIAAVEQLRTYADIIDLPMEIVATPRDMHQALARMAELDLILMDTAGRSPRDEVKIQELKSLLAQAAPDEVHLVLSCTSGAATLAKTAAQFAGVGTTSLLLTKLDEATSLGNLLPLVRSARLPLSYVTHGQNVPNDIASADSTRLARAIIGLETIGTS